MTTTELVEFLATGTFTDEEAYDLITGDLDRSGEPILEAAAMREGQFMIRYFRYKIEAVLLPAIRQAKTQQ